MLLPVHKNTKLLIFDCDGTIANNMHIHIDAWEKVLSSEGIGKPPFELEKYNGLPSEYILKEVFKLNTFELAKITEKIKEETHRQLSKTKPILPIVNLIKNYHNKLPMVVISGGKKENVHKALDLLDITSLFDEIITADDDHPTKETPEAFLLLAKRYNLECKECHVFEDGVQGLINALRAGMTITDVRNITLY